MPKRLNSLWTLLYIFRFMPINVKPQLAQYACASNTLSLTPPQWQTLGSATAKAHTKLCRIYDKVSHSRFIVPLDVLNWRAKLRPFQARGWATSLQGAISRASCPKERTLKRSAACPKPQPSGTRGQKFPRPPPPATNCGLRQPTLQLLGNAPSNPHLVSIRFTGE